MFNNQHQLENYHTYLLLGPLGTRGYQSAYNARGNNFTTVMIISMKIKTYSALIMMMIWLRKSVNYHLLITVKPLLRNTRLLLLFTSMRASYFFHFCLFRPPLISLSTFFMKSNHRPLSVFINHQSSILLFKVKN